MKKAVIYARYSAGPKQTDISIEGQVRECKNYIEQKGYTFTKSYCDKHISGKTDQRPAFQEMISDAKKFDVVVVYSLDRFSRDKYDHAIYKKKLKDLGVSVESSQEYIPDGPEGILMESVLEGFAAYYSAELSRKIKRGMTDRALKAQYVGSQPALGYVVKQDKTFAIDEKIAPTIREVYKKYLGGSSFTEIMNWLNDLGFRTSRKKPFNKNSVKRILTNEAYIGVYKWGDVRIENGYPPIINEGIFQMVQQKIKEKSRGHAPKGNFLLTGKLYCGICGHKLIGTSGTSKSGKVYYYYKCPSGDQGNIKKEYFELYIAELVKEAFESSSELDDLADKLFTLQLEENATEDEIGALKHELASINTQIDKLIDLVFVDKYTDRVHQKVLILEEQKKELEAQIEEKEESKERIIPKDLIRKGLEAFLSGLLFTEDDLITEKILEAFVHRVTLFEDYLIIEFNIRGLEGLKTSDPIVFEQSEKWWTYCNQDRTRLVATNRGICIICKKCINI